MSQNRKNLRRNKKGAIVAYDTDETYRITIRNRKLQDAPLIVRAYLNGYWKMQSHSDAYERKDAQTIEFQVTVPGRSEKEMTFKVEGLNLQGGFVLNQ